MLCDGLFDGQDDAQGTLIHVADGYGFEVRVIGNAGEAIIAVAGEIDMATARLLGQVMDGACEGRERLVVDLTGTTFIDSSGLVVLVRAHQRLGRRPGAVVVHASDPHVRQVFRISGVDSLITVTSAPP
jgi:anti-anti-sigma factor